MRIGPSHQAGSDSLLTAATFFKMRQIYFQDQIDDAEYNGILYGFGQASSASSGVADTTRGGATIAEREDRAFVRDSHNQTPSAGLSQNPSVSFGSGPIAAPSLGGISSSMSAASYGQMSNGHYLRTAMGGR